MGRSKGGLTTKIHALVDALGNPTGFHLTGGQEHDLAGADALLPQDGSVQEQEWYTTLTCTAMGKEAQTPPRPPGRLRR